jgi:2,3-bisphosphoglycerate-dependent phosphoglycerate mutase
MERAILARHGESEFSARRLVSGDPTLPGGGLTEAGREQARELGRLLADEPIDLCVTSEFRRTQETADLALAGRDVPRLVLADLNDIRVGEYEGRSFDDYRAWVRAHGPADGCPGGGESRAAVAERYAGALRVVLDRPEDTILVVAHSLPIRYVLLAVADRDPTAVVDLVEYALPHRLAREDVERAATRLEAWCASPVFA